jgi:hypothetical protein
MSKSLDLMDYVAILTNSSLDQARVNTMKDAKPLEFYAVVAFPPEAADALFAVVQQSAPGGDVTGLEIGVKTNAEKGTKAIPGIPGDWLIARAATQYPPYISDATGQQLDQAAPGVAPAIRSAFYAGKRVRVALASYAWTFAKTGRRGISFNLNGVMDAGEDGDRLSIGVGKIANAFAAHANPNAKPIGSAPVPGDNAQTIDKPNNANPFGSRQGTQGGQTEQRGGGAQGNPFAQRSASVRVHRNPNSAPVARLIRSCAVRRVSA